MWQPIQKAASEALDVARADDSGLEGACHDLIALLLGLDTPTARGLAYAVDIHTNCVTHPNEESREANLLMLRGVLWTVVSVAKQESRFGIIG